MLELFWEARGQAGEDIMKGLQRFCWSLSFSKLPKNIKVSPAAAGALTQPWMLFFIQLLDNPWALSSSRPGGLSCKGQTAHHHLLAQPNPKLQLSSLQEQPKFAISRGECSTSPT